MRRGGDEGPLKYKSSAAALNATDEEVAVLGLSHIYNAGATKRPLTEHHRLSQRR